MEDHSSSTLLETSDKLTMMSHKSREQSELIESLTRDLKQSINEKTLIKNDLSDRINALISQRNVFATHMSEMETIWNEKLQAISGERDKLQSQLKSMIVELKHLSDNPAVITARKHAKEMEEKLKSNESDMNLLMESIKQEKSTLIGRIHDQAISIHDLTEQDKSSDKNWINLAVNDNSIPASANKSYSRIANANSTNMNNSINSSLLNNTPGTNETRSYSFIDSTSANASPYRSSPMKEYTSTPTSSNINSNRYLLGKTPEINMSGNNNNSKKLIFDNELPSFLK